MHSSNNTGKNWFTRKSAFLSFTAATLFLLVAIFNQGWNWRGMLLLSAGILWLVIGYRQVKNSPRNTPMK